MQMVTHMKSFRWELLMLLFLAFSPSEIFSQDLLLDSLQRNGSVPMSACAHARAHTLTHTHTHTHILYAYGFISCLPLSMTVQHSGVSMD